MTRDEELFCRARSRTFLDVADDLTAHSKLEDDPCVRVAMLEHAARYRLAAGKYADD